MCTAYAKEIRAWVCDEALSQRERMMDAWGQAFRASDEEGESPANVLPIEDAAPVIDLQEQLRLCAPRAGNKL